MSGNTPPTPSHSPSATSPSQTQENAPSGADVDRLVLQYLRAKGHNVAEKAFLSEIEGFSSDAQSARPETINAEELVKTLAVFTQDPSRLGDNALKDSSTVLSELSAINPPALQTLISNISSVGSEEILTENPSDKPEGFRELVAWVEGSLDMYRVCYTQASDYQLFILFQPEFRPILFPIFCHFYLDLIQAGRKDAGGCSFGNSIYTYNLSQPSSFLQPFHLSSKPHILPLFIICLRYFYQHTSKMMNWPNVFATRSILSVLADLALAYYWAG